MANSLPSDSSGKGFLISFDESCIGEVGSKKLEIDIDASRYSEEVYTTSYVFDLFNTLNTVFSNCQQLIECTKQYFTEAIEISDNVEQPDIVSIDFNIANQESLYTTNTGVVVTQGGKLNVRSSPNGDVVSQVSNGDSVEIIGPSAENSEWIEVRQSDGSTAYVHSDYIKMNDNSANAAAKPLQNQEIKTSSMPNQILPDTEILSNSASVNISSGTLNVRSSPNGEIISSLNKNDIVEIIGKSSENSNWTKIKLSDGKEAYVFSKYIMETK